MCSITARNNPAAPTKRKRRNDLIFIAALAVVTMAAGMCFYYLRPPGDTVEVLIDGVSYATYSLDEDRVVDIDTGDDGSQHNRLVIRDQTAFVESASCFDGICAGHRPISREGESIACLPHRVVIIVRPAADGRTDSTPDIVV